MIDELWMHGAYNLSYSSGESRVACNCVEIHRTREQTAPLTQVVGGEKKKVRMRC